MRTLAINFSQFQLAARFSLHVIVQGIIQLEQEIQYMFVTDQYFSFTSDINI